VNYRLFLAISFVGILVARTSEAQEAPTQETPKPQAFGLAQTTVVQTAAVNCGDSTNQTAMNQCFEREAKQDQLLLDALLKELAAKLDAPNKERLEEVQSQWGKYRDAHCRWQAGFFEGGSVQPTMYSTCLSALIWNRIDELKLNLCEGAGMTGPCEASKRYDRPGLTSR
jgi:uncharacterized protein YecT (DUF1311 family)